MKGQQVLNLTFFKHKISQALEIDFKVGIHLSCQSEFWLKVCSN